MVREMAVLAFFLSPAAAWAQVVTAEASAGAQTVETAPATRPTKQPATAPQIKDTPVAFQGRLSGGHALYMKGDFQGALSEYEAAKQASPGEAIVYYYIGFAQAKLARYDDAVVTLKTVCTLAGEKDPSLQAKAMFAIAVVEELRWSLEAAKEAWIAYQGFYRTHESAKAFPATAEARLAAIEKMKKLDEDYAVVRERIGNSK